MSPERLTCPENDLSQISRGKTAATLPASQAKVRQKSGAVACCMSAPGVFAGVACILTIEFVKGSGAITAAPGTSSGLFCPRSPSFGPLPQ